MAPISKHLLQENSVGSERDMQESILYQFKIQMVTIWYLLTIEERVVRNKPLSLPF